MHLPVKSNSEKNFARRILNLFQIMLVLITFNIPTNAFSADTFIPNYWNPNERFVQPATSKLGNIRFITTTDFPPFSFIGGEKQISGFHVDLARAICSELGKLNTCQIQALPWPDHQSAMEKDKNAVLISGLAINSDSRRKYTFTRTYLTLPARFIGRKTNSIGEPLFQNLNGKVIGFVGGTAHEAFLKANFTSSKLRAFSDQGPALKALIKKEIEVIFSGALQISYWLHSKQSNNCCEFVGGPYLAPKYFGAGLAIAVNPENRELLGALNYALRTISEKGIFSELYLRYFPESLF